MTSKPTTSDEFRIVITGTGITATYRPFTGSERQVGGPEDLPASDTLAMQTVQLLETWLNVWDRIDADRVKSSDILSEATLRIIGRHLWSLILDNSIGQELVTRVADHLPKEPGARRQGARRPARELRVLITFDDGSSDRKLAVYETLKGLPWEFLYVDEVKSPLFLAAAANFQLARFVKLPDTDFAPTFSDTTSLRVQFVTALPEKGYSDVWVEVQKFRRAVQGITGIEAPYPIEGLDTGAIKGALSEPFHIIHLVGLCKGPPGKAEMLLQSDGVTRWQDPGTLIDALTPAGVHRPRLVILHLCEDKEGDATENFERLAPALIARGVPTVLALQYPMHVEPSTAIGLEFYRKLARGDLIGAAVQTSRHEMLAETGRRNFGTPVLYLQQDGIVVKLNPKQTTGDEKQLTPTDTDSKPPDIRLRLLQVVTSPPPEIDRTAALGVIDELSDEGELPADAGTAISILKALLKAHENDPDQMLVINYLLKLLQSPQRGSEDARPTPAGQRRRTATAQFVSGQHA